MRDGAAMDTFYDGPDQWYRLRGRIRRRRYWLGYQLPLLPLAAIIFALLATGHEAGFALAVITMLPALWLGIAGSVKRLHDHDLSGWAYVGFIVLAGLADLVHPLLGTLLGIPFFILLGLVRGTIGPNRYGPDLVPAVADAACLQPDGALARDLGTRP